MHELDVRAGDELERQMARYARVRLEPSPVVVRRAREAVMTEAWRQRLTASAAARPARRGLFAGWSARRLAVSLAAALVAGLMIGSSAFAASRAGGPLYEARLTLETLTLPSDPDARLDAELAQAQSRIAEAVDAAARHDDAALAAALAAYEHSLNDLVTTTGGPADRALEAVEFHHAVLLSLAGTVPDQALGGITNALDRSQGAIDRLGAEIGNGQPGGNGVNGAPAGQGAGPSPARPNGPDRSPGPAKSPKPAATAGPPIDPASQNP